MKRQASLLCMAVVVIGCGSPETEPVLIPEPHVTVIGLDGKEKSIPAAELYDSETGEPLVRSVLVFNRDTNKQAFVQVEQLPAESQANARFILITDSSSGVMPGDRGQAVRGQR